MIDGRSPIDELLRRAVRAGVSPAVVAGWGRVGEEYSYRALGKPALFRESSELTEHTWFDLASLTKPLVTTTLCLIAFRSGVLGPSTRVSEVLSELDHTAIGSIDVDAMLTHTSGLPAWLPLYALAKGRRDALPSCLGRVEVENPPQRRVVYSCIGFVVLGLMLERIADETLDALFRREVSAPLGIEDDVGFCNANETRLQVSGACRPTVEERLAEKSGFSSTWVPAIEHCLPDDGNARFLGGVAGNAGLFGNARGVVKLAAEYLPGGGSLLTAQESERAISLRAADDEQGRGWGWQLARSRACSAGPGLSENAYGHTGFTGVSVWCEPLSAAVLVLLTNRNHPAQRENDLHPLRRRFHSLAVLDLNS